MDTMVADLHGPLFPNVGSGVMRNLASMDAPLWFFWSLQQYIKFTGDTKTIKKKYLEKIQSKVEATPSIIQQELEGHDPRLVEIVNKLLEFNPYFRWTGQECIKSTYFDNIRNSNLEKHPKGKIMLEVDQDSAFDYEQGQSNIFTKDDYLKIIYKNSEIIRI